MGLDEFLFKKSHSWISSLRRRRNAPSQNVSYFENEKDRLCYFARLLSGTPIELVQSSDWGTYSQHVIFLPKQFDLGETQNENIVLFLHRILFCVGLQKKNIYLASDAGTQERFQLVVQNIENVRRSWASELTNLTEWLQIVDAIFARQLKTRNQEASTLLREIYGIGGFLERSLERKKEDLHQFNKPHQSKVRTELQASHRDVIQEVKNPKREDDNPAIHSFEKIQTAEDYQGGHRQLDGEDELAEQAEALDEIKIGHLIRTTERSESVYKADIRFHATAPDIKAPDIKAANEKTFYYDEWNESARQFRKGWCRVVETHTESRTDFDATTIESIHAKIGSIKTKQAKTISELSASLNKLLNVRRQNPRQSDGQDIGIDDVVLYRCELLAHADAQPKFYIQHFKQAREISTMILIDNSLSADSFIQNQKVLDIVKEAVVITANVFKQSRDFFSVASFNSHTRHKCRFQIIKDFSESWANCERQIVGLQAEGYTRMGPAIRHATFLLGKQPTRAKLLLVISDGKATDYDRYEGVYGVSDIRQALQSACVQGIHTHAIAIASDAKFYLPLMFGRHQYSILTDAEKLSPVLFSAYQRALVV